MNLAALLLLGLIPGADPSPNDFDTLRGREVELDIVYEPRYRDQIQQTQLLFSLDEGQTWTVGAAATPDKNTFTFKAERDGMYWLNMVTVYRNGARDPADVTRMPPAQKVLIDTTPPTVAVTKAVWDAGNAVVEWDVKDDYPNDAVTEVSYRTTGPTDIGWEPVSGANIVRRSVRFRPSASGSILVRVTAKDLAGNSQTATRELAAPAGDGGGPTTQVSGALEPGTLPGVIQFEAPPTGLPPPAVPTAAIQAPVMTPPTQPPSPPSVAIVRPVDAPAPPSPPGTTWTGSSAPAPGIGSSAPTPIAVGSGMNGTPATASTGLQVVNYARFDLQFQVDNGPSGVRQIDLYVTRDGGRTWTKWSQHDGQSSPLRVALDVPGNPQVEGDYGFRMVAISGAGLSDGPPAPGTPPEMQAHVDVTPPIVKVYAPTADPDRRNTLVLHWEATDRNFGPDPIGIEWSEHPSGPWQPVAGGGGVVPVVAGDGAGTPRVANTGSYSWALPSTLGTHRVFLRFTAWDRGGNRSQVVTPNPVMVDLTKPTVRIQGIVGGITPASGLVGGITPAP